MSTPDSSELVGENRLSVHPAHDLITATISDFPNIYDEAAIVAIIHLTTCQPYLIQLICSALIERLNQQKRDRITLDDVNTIAPLALERGKTYFDEFWNTLSPDHRDLLLKLSQSDQTSDPIAANISLNPAIIPQLTQLEILNGTTFQVPLIQIFIKTKII